MNAVCRGCWQLGSNCGKCDRCLETAVEGVAEIRRLAGVVAAAKQAIRDEAEAQHRLPEHALEALSRIASRIALAEGGAA